jgi:hypothetical protein
MYEHDINYFKCSPGVPPYCWKVSTLTFYAYVNLGYRRHAFRARTAVTYGTPPWSAWYSKKHMVVCREAKRFCGDWRGLVSTKAWSDVIYYKPDRLLTLDAPGWFRFRYSACMEQSCGYGVRRSTDIYCRARAKQCYFDV